MNSKKISRNVKSSLQLFWKRSGGVLIGLLVMAVLFYLAFNLNIFYVQNFEIEAFEKDELAYLDEEEIRDEISEFIGIRLFQLDVSKVEKKLRDNFPFISQVYVSKRAPNSLSIKIIERVPTLKLVKGNAGYLVDDGGVILGECVEYEKYCENVPFVGVTYYLGEINVGEKPFITELDEVIILAEHQSDLGLDIVEFLVPTERVISVVFDDSTRGIFSTEKDIENQISLYSYTRENLLLKNEKFKEIDIRFDRPVIRVDKYTY
ncbi:MAG: FtsQ-type POTRA domain-containing protein [bacterium]